MENLDNLGKVILLCVFFVCATLLVLFNHPYIGGLLLIELVLHL